MGSRQHRRWNLAEAQNWHCAYCGGLMDERIGRPDSATVEHVTPRRLGGINRRENLVSACASCNCGRGSLYSARAFYRLRSKMVRSMRWPPCQAPNEHVSLLLVSMRQRAEAHRISSAASILRACEGERTEGET